MLTFFKSKIFYEYEKILANQKSRQLIITWFKGKSETEAPTSECFLFNVTNMNHSTTALEWFIYLGV